MQSPHIKPPPLSHGNVFFPKKENILMHLLLNKCKKHIFSIKNSKILNSPRYNMHINVIHHKRIQ